MFQGTWDRFPQILFPFFGKKNAQMREWYCSSKKTDNFFFSIKQMKKWDVSGLIGGPRGMRQEKDALVGVSYGNPVTCI